MKSFLFLSLLLSSFIHLIKSDAQKAHRKRNKDTIELFLSKLQDSPIEDDKNIMFSFFSLKFSSCNFYPTITNNMIITPRANLMNQYKVYNYILTFFCNVTVGITGTTKKIQENDFIIELNVTDSGFKAGITLRDPLEFKFLNDFLTTYSDKRNFLVSKRFYTEFETERAINGKFTDMIRNIIEYKHKILSFYNYQQIDFLNINNQLLNVTKKINKEINSTLILESYSFTSYDIPDARINADKLEIRKYNAKMSYTLILNGVIGSSSPTLHIELPLFQFSYNVYDFNHAEYSGDNTIDEVNRILFDEFKEIFREKAKEYYDTFTDN